MHVSVQTWSYVIKPFQLLHLAFPRVGIITVAIVLTVCCALALTRYARLAPILALPALVLRLYWMLLWIPKAIQKQAKNNGFDSRHRERT